MAEIGIYLPNVGWDNLPSPSQLADYAVAAEEIGFHSLWVEDRLLHSRVGVLDALTTLTFVASCTHRLRLGTSILLVNLRNPLVLAKAISSLDYLSGGRVVLGASLGGRPDEYRVTGIPMRTRVTRFVETLRAMRSFWGQGSFEGVSRFFESTDQAMEPRPVQNRIPIWIGGRVEAVHQRVATIGDGWLASSTTSNSEFAQGWARIQQLATESGRDPNSLTPAKFCYIHVDDDSGKALQVLSQSLPKYYDFPYDVAGNTIYGPPSRCIEQASAILDAGVSTLIFSTVTGDRAQLERVGREVVPHLK